jgi:hypothetical protein
MTKWLSRTKDWIREDANEKANVVIALATVLNLAVAIFMWVATRGQLNAAREQLVIDSEQLRKVQRPFVAFDESIISKWLTAQVNGVYLKGFRGLELQQNLHNYGPLPATILETKMIAYIDSIQLSTSTTHSVVMLMPQESQIINNEILDSLIQDVVDRKRNLAVRFYITYQGAFPDTYETMQFLEFQGRTGRHSGFEMAESYWK